MRCGTDNDGWPVCGSLGCACGQCPDCEPEHNPGCTLRERKQMITENGTVTNATCPRCQGSGTIQELTDDGKGYKQSTCPRCSGSGSI